MKYTEVDRFDYLCKNAFNPVWLKQNKKIDLTNTIFETSSIPKFYDTFKQFHLNNTPLISDIISPEMAEHIDNYFNYMPLKYNTYLNKLKTLLQFPLFMENKTLFLKYAAEYNDAPIKNTPFNFTYKEVDIDEILFSKIRYEYRDILAETIFKKDGSADQFFDITFFNENSPMAKLYRMSDEFDYMTPFDLVSPFHLMKVIYNDSEINLNDEKLKNIHSLLMARVVTQLEKHIKKENYENKEYSNSIIETLFIMRPIRDESTEFLLQLEYPYPVIYDAIEHYNTNIAQKIQDHSLYEELDINLIQKETDMTEDDLVRIRLNNIKDYLEKYFYTDQTYFNEHIYKIKLLEDLSAMIFLNKLYTGFSATGNVTLDLQHGFVNTFRVDPKILSLYLNEYSENLLSVEKIFTDYLLFGWGGYKSLIKRGWFCNVPFLTNGFYQNFKNKYPEMPTVYHTTKKTNTEFEDYFQNEIGANLDQIRSV